MSICYNGRGTVLIKENSVKVITEQFVKLMALYDGISINAVNEEDVVAYVQELSKNFKGSDLVAKFGLHQDDRGKWVFQFKNYARHGFVTDSLRIIRDNLEAIEEGQLWFDCNDEDGSPERPFPFIVLYEIVDGEIYDQVLETRLPYDWEMHCGYDKNVYDVPTGSV